MKEKRRIGLTRQVAWSFIAISIALIIIMGSTLYLYFKNNVETSLKSSLSTVVDNNAANVDDLLARISLAMDIINSEQSGMVANLSEYSGNLIEEFPKYELAKNQFKTYFNVTIGDAIPKYKAFLFLDDSMEFSSICWSRDIQSLLQGASTTTPMIFSNQEVSGEAWYKKAKELKGEPYWFRLPGNDMIFIAKELSQMVYVGNRVQNHTLGVIFFGMDVSWIRQKINAGELTEGTKIILADSSQQVIYSEGGKDMEGMLLSELFDVSRLESDRQEEGSLQYISLDGAQHLAKRTDLQEGLTLITMIPTADVERIADGTVQIIAVVVVVMIGAGAFLIAVISKSVVNPIRRLSDHMKNSRRLELIPCDGVKTDEVRVMYESYNHLMESLEQLIEEVYYSTQRQKIAEMKTLQAQINPHFVYNTLDSVCCISLMRGQDDIAETLSSLASLMRYNIKNLDEMVPIAKELEMIQNYIRIQQLRYEDRLNLDVEMELDPEQWLIPKMIIQPLVENSVTHGADMENGNGEIQIIFREKENSIEIVVHDNGLNTDVEEINRHLAGIKNISKDSGGLGIRNVNQRIQMKFGEKYRLRFERAEDGWVNAVVIVPKVQK